MIKLLSSPSWWLLLVLSTVFFAGCAGSGTADRNDMSGQLPIAGSLPPLPQDMAGARQPAAAQSTLQTGEEAVAKSAGAQVQSPQMVLPAAANTLQWAYFQFNVGTAATLTDVQVHFTMDAGTKTWIGLSNYTENHWDLSGPFSATQDVMLNTGPDYISSAGNFYVLVAAYDLNTTRLQELFLTYDDGIAAVNYVADARPFLVTNCAGCHPAQTPLNVFAPEAYDGAMSELAAIKTYVQSDHNGSYSAADKTMIAAWVDAGGPLGATATHYTAVATQLFSLHCDSCHSTTLSGGARNGAPTDVNTNTYAAASAYMSNNESVAKRCNATTQSGSMPPAGQLSTPLRALHQAWIDSGWPN